MASSEIRREASTMPGALSAGNCLRCALLPPPLKLFLIITILGLYWQLGCPEILAAPPLEPHWFTRFWKGGDNGLPENNVTSVLQTRDGYLWLGTRSGLARFDGARFTVFNNNNTPEMHSSHVTALYEADNGVLWIGYDTGELTSYDSGVFHDTPVHAAWRGGKISAICSDAAGDVWLLNQHGELARIRDGLIIPWVSSGTVHQLALLRNPAGGIWAQRDSDVSLLADGKLQSIFEASSTNLYIQGICPARDGGLWVMMEGRIRKWQNKQWTLDYEHAPWDMPPTPNLIETREGYLAVGTADHGLYLVSPGNGNLRFCRTNGFSSDWINALCQDREGNLWVGTGNGGLAMLRVVNVKTLSPPDEWQGRAVLSVDAGGDGTLWAGTEGAGLYSFQDGNWTNYGVASGLRHYYVWAVAPDAPGGVRVGTWGGGIYQQKNGSFETNESLGSFFVAALCAAHDGGTFAGTSEGLMHLEADRTTWLARKPELLSPDVRTVCEGTDGTIWFGMSGGGLGRLQNGKLRQFRRGDGLSSDFVQCLHLETDGTLWIGTFGGGLNRFKNGQFVAIRRSQGLRDEVICDIQDDGQGYFWISSHGGIMRINKAELTRYADGDTTQLHCLTLGLSDGLPSLECSGGFQPASCKTADGNLWFPTAKGLVSVDPKVIKINPYPPPVVIEEVRVDGQAVTNNATDAKTLQIAPGRHRLEFDYAGLSFVAPERVRFKYRLEGLDHEWVDAAEKRLADYSYIPPGNYVFRVTACNSDEVWSEAGASLAFTVLPYFWQTWWFRMVAALGAALVVGGSVLIGTRRRMRLKLDRLEREQAVERERTRIAKDIHDDLGASLTRISMISQSARASIEEPTKILRFLDQIFLTARESTRALADIVWAVNPSHDTLDSLAAYLQKFAQNFLRDANVRCRIDMPLELPMWPLTADIRHNLLLAFKEAVNNVVRHANATEIRISLKVEPQSFALTIQDNGCGFKVPVYLDVTATTSEQSPAANGLKNMSLRLGEIGGHFEIVSSEGAGTKITFFLPVPTA